MDNKRLLVVAMAEQCRSVIQGWSQVTSGLPSALQPKHLLWMCQRITEQAEDRPPTTMHRWIGFIQGGMLANGMLDLDGLKAMFDEAKRAYGGTIEDIEDLTDHLDPTSSFEFDLGGQG